MKTLWVTIGVLGLGLVAAPSRAEAGVIRYLGPHPVSPRLGKGMCHISGPHVHAYSPHQSVLYVRQGPAYVFVGDPVEFEPKSPRHSYYGHHPVFWIGDAPDARHYCYIAGPHFHWYAPPVTLRARYTKKGGAYWFVGGHPKWYKKHHWRGPALARHYGRAHLHVPRPVIAVGPPAGWIGVVVAPADVKVKIKGPHGHIDIKGGVPWGHLHGHGHVKVKGHGMGHGHVKVKGHGHGHGHVKIKGYGMHHGMGHGHGHGHGEIKIKGKIKW